MLSTLTYKVAHEITSDRFGLDKFFEHGGCCEFIYFAHRNFFYSYPEFEKRWPDGKPCQYHSVNLKCHLCDCVPDRNYAGFGNMFLLHNGVSDTEILICNKKERKYIPNTPRLSPMICLCKHHTAGYFQFNKLTTVEKQVVQLDLFSQ